MIQLDYQTNNPRWGWSGIWFNTWEGYALTLGFLANINHYRNYSFSTSGPWDSIIELHVEGNNIQGAWGKEGRIQYYGTDNAIKTEFVELYNVKSAGNSGITWRFNSNDYMYSLVYDYNFIVKTFQGYTTADIFPPVNDPYNSVWSILEKHLKVMKVDIVNIKFFYDSGWNK
jgi:hypothetical protein